MDIIYSAFFTRRETPENPPISPRDQTNFADNNAPETITAQQQPPEDDARKYWCTRCCRWLFKKNRARHDRTCNKVACSCVICYDGPLRPDSWFINNACGHGVYSGMTRYDRIWNLYRIFWKPNLSNIVTEIVVSFSLKLLEWDLKKAFFGQKSAENLSF